MTPKEKAQELIDAFTFSCTECDYKFNAVRSALRAVDEIMNSCIGSHEKYWQEVKQQIENL